jgi:hypothetical protein
MQRIENSRPNICLKNLILVKYFRARLHIFKARIQYGGRHDIWNNDTQHNGTQHNSTERRVPLCWVSRFLLLCGVSICWASLCWVSWSHMALHFEIPFTLIVTNIAGYSSKWNNVIWSKVRSLNILAESQSLSSLHLTRLPALNSQ